MPPRRGKKVIILTEQQANGFFSDLAKQALKIAAPIIKKEGKKLAKKALKKGVAVGRKRARKTKLGRQFGIGPGGTLRLAGQGPRRGKRRGGRRKKKAKIRVVML